MEETLSSNLQPGWKKLKRRSKRNTKRKNLKRLKLLGKSITERKRKRSEC